MTFSIIFFDTKTGTAGVGTATGNIAVGAFVPHVEAGVGALATQGAYTNWLYGEMGLNLLRQEEGATSVLQKLLAKDTGRESRQCFIVDKNGQTAGWTGKDNGDIRELIKTENIVAGGNLLAKTGIADALIKSFTANDDAPFALRLIDALKAAEQAGGDSRGLLSAAIKVDFLHKPPIDLRVDYAPGNTLDTLREIYSHYQSAPFTAFYNGVPTKNDFSKCG